MLRLFYFIQVTGYFAVYGIMTHEMPVSPRSHQKTVKQNSWQTILREATFQSLIKQTGFTPSLDQKIETDRLLYEKLQESKFLKNPSKSDKGSKIMTGVLLDMTKETGHLEFRQNDCDANKCKSLANRVLAVWKMQKFEPNNIWVNIKVPRSSYNEDVFEYTPKLGLRQINVSKNMNKTRELQIKTTTMPIDRRIDQFYNMEDVIKQIMNKQPQKAISYSNFRSYRPRARVLKPTGKQLDWTKSFTYYQVQPFYPEFQKGGAYDGFIPSIGPTGFPYYSPTVPVKEFHFKQVTKPAIHTTPKSFKPSVKFIHYSEPDPFYLDKNIDATIKPIRDEKPLYPSSINEQLSSIETESNETEQSEAESNNEAKTQPTANTITANQKAKPKIFKLKDEIKSTTKPSIAKKVTKVPESSVEMSDFAPMHMKWGQKVISNVTKQKEITKPMNQTAVTESLIYKNVGIGNYEGKSPEEIVTNLTNIGFKNTTRVEGYPEISKDVIENSNKLINRIKGQIIDESDPVTVIINRISKSYSYKTGKGRVKKINSLVNLNKM